MNGQPVPLLTVRKQLEAAEGDPRRIAEFLRQATYHLDGQIALGSLRLMHRLEKAPGDWLPAYRWLLKTAEAFARVGGFQ